MRNLPGHQNKGSTDGEALQAAVPGLLLGGALLPAPQGGGVVAMALAKRK